MDVGTLTVELSYRCHRRCAFCYVPKSNVAASPAKDLPALELARLAADVAERAGCRHVQLSGGEPLLCDDLLPAIDLLSRAGTGVSIVTDGGPLDTTLARALASRPVRMLQPTLLAAEPEIHDRLRGRGSFREVTRAIATAAEAGLRVSVCMVILRVNASEAAGVAELAFALGASGLALSRFCAAGAAAEQAGELAPSPSEVRAAAEAAAQACRSIGMPLAAAVTIPRCVWDDPARAPLRVGVCSLVGPRAAITIGPDGSVRSCALSQRTLGKLGVDGWQDIAAALERERCAVAAAAPPPCRACRAWAQCLGGCRLSGAAATGDPAESAATADPLATACPS